MNFPVTFIVTLSVRHYPRAERGFNLMNLSLWLGLMLFLGCLPGRALDSTVNITEEQRLSGFTEHNRANREADRARESGAAEVKDARSEWDQHLQNAVKDYKKWKARQAQGLDEKSPEYRLEKQNQLKEIKESEENQARYVRERNRRLAKQKSNILLTEEQEYHLDEVPDRAEIKNRTLFGGKPSWLKDSKSSGTALSGSGSTPTPDYSSAPPPPPPSEPSFYEPEIPPPPPPDFGGFDDPPPPMPFDEPEY